MEWISVKDKLPLDDILHHTCHIFDDNILAVFDDGEGDISVAGASYSNRNGWGYPDGTPHDFWQDKITHWMRFPDPPKR